MSKVLLTGGRAPAALALARALHRAGHTVFMAESSRLHLSRPSNAIARNFDVPPPRQQAEAYVRALSRIVADNAIDVLLPCGEEILYIAGGRDRIGCRVFAETPKQLDILHNKWFFLVTAIELELFVPETILVANEDDLLHVYAQWRDLVLKPVYSRFNANNLMRPSLKEALARLTFDLQWIAQEFIAGHRFSTYSVCHHGQLSAHVTYQPLLTAGPHAAIDIRPVDHPGILAWVKTYLGANQFTGQIGIDFIESNEGQLFALQTTPGATNGLHLLVSNPEFAECFLHPKLDFVTPLDRSEAMLTTAMFAYALPYALRKLRVREWLATLLSSRDMILDWSDALPFFLQWRSVLPTLRAAQTHKLRYVDAAAYDVLWDGNHEE